MSLTEAQIEQRRTLVTASDVAAICGENPYRSLSDVWAEKVNGSTFHGNYRTRRGHAVEPLLVAWLGEKVAPLVVRPAGDVTLTAAIWPWLGATCDGMAHNDVVAVATCEAKVTELADDWLAEDGSWKVADYYMPQVQTQMIVTGLRRAYVVAEVAGEREPIVLEAEYDQEMATAIIELCEHFHRTYLLPKRTPPLEDATYKQVANVFRKPRTSKLIAATPETSTLAAEYFALGNEVKRIEHRRGVIQAELCRTIACDEGISGDGWRCIWKERAATTVSYEKAAYRHFDMREVKVGEALRNHRKKTGA